MMIATAKIDPAPASTGTLPPRHLDFGVPALERRLNALLLRHARLDRQLRREAGAAFKDGFIIQRLKRLKLRAKDEMALLKAVLRAERVQDVPPGSPPCADLGGARRGTA